MPITALEPSALDQFDAQPLSLPAHASVAAKPKRRAYKVRRANSWQGSEASQTTELLTLAASIFGGVAVASVWICEPHPLLGISPIQAMQSRDDATKVFQLLHAISQGAPWWA